MKPAALTIWLVLPCMGLGWLLCHYYGSGKLPQKPRDIRVAQVTEPFLVDDIQAWLVAQGQAIEVDGKWGRKTDEAINAVYCETMASRWME